ncbi:chloramphenicol acetyltransferase [Paramecium bursaria Chlorella virus CvsA1]|nr:chloramphenicol acetyltransferase [Paramecium bursaria Chlorella virus CviKI]AGE52491.1 chloramphenicol acetyltransferase [Paramecium bursaria Chlorella virus CvsA1]AGE55259.1 chloramphenicol acetyltransferase [Paramecium bursaria Chlorella virus MA1E]
MIKPDIKHSTCTYGVPHVINHDNSPARLHVGAFTSIGGGVKIYLGMNHRVDFITTYPFGTVFEDIFGSDKNMGHPSTRGDVVIGNDVWLADGVTIMSGVTIGDGAVVACNSHVVKDVEPYSIVGGNPAKHIKYRFSKETIDSLLELKWWNLPIHIIQKIVKLLMSADVENNIEKIKEIIKREN